MKKVLCWAPRVLGILFVLFLMMFSFDVFEMEATFIEKIGGFLIHNIPTFIMALVVGFAWRRPLVGTGGFAVGASFYLVMMIIVASNNLAPVFEAIVWSLPLSGPALLIAVLYLLNWLDNKQKSNEKESIADAQDN